MATRSPASTELPIPEFFDPDHAAHWGYRPDQQTLLARAVAWRERFDLQPACRDTAAVRLLLIDLQKDFCFPEGALYVGGRSGRGAVDDNARLARFIYRHLDWITEIACTLDSHSPHQIFFPAFWVDEAGAHPAAHREVTAAEVRAGGLRPDPVLANWLSGGDYARLAAAALHYCEELERRARYTLYLWPPHCLIGSAGHALAGVIHEARLFHGFARQARQWTERKGEEPLTERYSALSPEVGVGPQGEVWGERNRALLELLLDADALIVAGQAASHCVLYTLDDLATEIRARDPRRARRVYILEDCMSSVTVPAPDRPGEFLFDFTREAEAGLRRLADEGMHLVRSTTPLDEWPDFPLTG